MEYLVTKS